MKKLKALALAGALALFAAGSAYAENWVHLGYDGNDALYYDADSVSRQGPLTAVVGREVEKDGEKEDHYFLFQTEKNMYTESKVVEYDRQGNVKEIKTRNRDNAPWRPVRPGSEEELLLEAVKHL